MAFTLTPPPRTVDAAEWFKTPEGRIELENADLSYNSLWREIVAAARIAEADAFQEHGVVLTNVEAALVTQMERIIAAHEEDERVIEGSYYGSEYDCYYPGVRNGSCL